MKNLKFGGFCLALFAAVGMAVAGLGAQDTKETRRAPDRGTVMMFDGQGIRLGVVVSDVDAGQGAGVKVDEVRAGSAASKAGLKAGDVVVEFDGERVRSARQFTRLVQETPGGRTVKMAILRDGQKQTLDVTFGAPSSTWDMNIDGDRLRRDMERGLREFRMPEGDMTEVLRMRSSRGRLGATVQELSSELADYFGAKGGGALVASVRKGSAAEKAGLKAGDVITTVNGDRVDDADDLIRELEGVTGDVSLGVIRDKKAITLKATISG